MAAQVQLSSNFRIWPVVVALAIVSAPLVLMYAYLFVDTVTDSAAGSLIPNELTLRHWDFLWQTRSGKPSIWLVALNTLVFATSTTLIVNHLELDVEIAPDLFSLRSLMR